MPIALNSGTESARRSRQAPEYDRDVALFWRRRSPHPALPAYSGEAYIPYGSSPQGISRWWGSDGRSLHAVLVDVVAAELVRLADVKVGLVPPPRVHRRSGEPATVPRRVHI